MPKFEAAPIGRRPGESAQHNAAFYLIAKPFGTGTDQHILKAFRLFGPEAVTHAAFYVGWPKAWAAFNMAKEVYAE